MATLLRTVINSSNYLSTVWSAKSKTNRSLVTIASEDDGRDPFYGGKSDDDDVNVADADFNVAADECFFIDKNNFDSDSEFARKMETLEQRLHELDCKVSNLLWHFQCKKSSEMCCYCSYEVVL